MREAVWVKKIEPFKYVPLVFKVGGNMSHPLYARWNNMLNRCYDPNQINYPSYGGKGVSVCERWHTFSNWLQDVTGMLSYSSSRVLDKDYFGSNQYNPESCRWIPEPDNHAYRGKPVYIRDTLFLNIGLAAQYLKINRFNLAKYLDGNPKMLSELTRMSLQVQRVRYAIKEGYVARYKE